MKHTPGPWMLIGKIGNNTVSTWILAKDDTSESERKLQVISMQDSHPDKEHLERRYADMKLIAAAPELLEACIEALEEINTAYEILKIDNPGEGGVRKRLENAIAKAQNQKP